MPSTAEVRSLLRQFLREGKKIPNYNIREYVKRRAKDAFRPSEGQSLTADEAVWKAAKAELDVVRRQAIVYSMYARNQRSVMDVPVEQVLQEQSETPSAA